MSGWRGEWVRELKRDGPLSPPAAAPAAGAAQEGPARPLSLTVGPATVDPRGAGDRRLRGGQLPAQLVGGVADRGAANGRRFPLAPRGAARHNARTGPRDARYAF